MPEELLSTVIASILLLLFLLSIIFIYGKAAERLDYTELRRGAGAGAEFFVYNGSAHAKLSFVNVTNLSNTARLYSDQSEYGFEQTVAVSRVPYINGTVPNYPFMVDFYVGR